MTDIQPQEPDRLLKPTEVAEMFQVSPKTVTRWARSGRLPCVTTLGGHRRYRLSEIQRVMKDHEIPTATSDAADATATS